MFDEAHASTPNSVFYQVEETKGGSTVWHTYVNPDLFGGDVVAMAKLLVEIEELTPDADFVGESFIVLNPQMQRETTFVWEIALYYMKYGYEASRSWFETMTLLRSNAWFKEDLWSIRRLFFELTFETAMETPEKFFSYWNRQYEDHEEWHDLADFFIWYARREMGLPEEESDGHIVYHVIEAD